MCLTQSTRKLASLPVLICCHIVAEMFFIDSADCLVCSQPLPEQVSSSIQGLIVFECGRDIRSFYADCRDLQA